MASRFGSPSTLSASSVAMALSMPEQLYASQGMSALAMDGPCQGPILAAPWGARSRYPSRPHPDASLPQWRYRPIVVPAAEK
jgi:hypothetical protein